MKPIYKIVGIFLFALLTVNIVGASDNITITIPISPVKDYINNAPAPEDIPGPDYVTIEGEPIPLTKIKVGEDYTYKQISEYVYYCAENNKLVFRVGHQVFGNAFNYTNVTWS